MKLAPVLTSGRARLPRLGVSTFVLALIPLAGVSCRMVDPAFLKPTPVETAHPGQGVRVSAIAREFHLEPFAMPDGREFLLTGGETTVSFRLGSRLAFIDETSYRMPEAPQPADPGDLLVPYDFYLVLKGALASRMTPVPVEPRIEVPPAVVAGPAVVSTAGIEPIATPGYTVVIDAGHGGKDPGASSAGVREKDLVLALALKVQAKLEKAGFTVVMTRQDDRYPTLQARVRLSNRRAPACFVSLHVNAVDTPRVAGFETLYKSRAETRHDEDAVARSRTLAGFVQTEVARVATSHNRGVKKNHRRLYVLRANRCPAVIAELGFVTNPQERAKLVDPRYQDELAVALARALRRYHDWDRSLEAGGAGRSPGR